MGKNVISVPKFGEILTARPDGMEFGEYKKLMREQRKRLKRRLGGVFVWKSKFIGMGVQKETGFKGESWGTALAERVPEVRII